MKRLAVLVLLLSSLTACGSDATPEKQILRSYNGSGC